jgi:nucleotide-binding universal stress UspA family protein
MRRFKQILVGVDESDASIHALDQAIHLAGWSHAHITALTVVPPYEGDLSLVGTRHPKKLMEEPGLHALKRAWKAAEARSFPIDIGYDTGNPVKAILSHADAIHADLVVIGSRKNHSILASLLRGTCFEMIRNCRRNLLLVPEDAHLDWVHIYVLLSGHKTDADFVIQSLELAAMHGGKSLTVSVPSDIPETMVNRIYDTDSLRRTLDQIRKTHIHRMDIHQCRMVRRSTDSSPYPEKLPENTSLVILPIPMGNHLQRFRDSILREKLMRSSGFPMMQLHPDPKLQKIGTTGGR